MQFRVQLSQFQKNAHEYAHGTTQHAVKLLEGLGVIRPPQLLRWRYQRVWVQREFFWKGIAQQYSQRRVHRSRAGTASRRFRRLRRNVADHQSIELHRFLSLPELA